MLDLLDLYEIRKITDYNFTTPLVVVHIRYMVMNMEL